MRVGGRRGESRALVALAPLLLLVLAACETPATTTDGPTRPPTSRVSIAPAASVGPSPSQDPGQAAMTKFFTLATGSGFAYQATFTGQSRHTVAILPISSGSLQVSGKDVRVRATFRFEDGTRVPVEHRYVGGTAWIKYGPLAWQRLSKFGAASSMGAFAQVKGPRDVTYLGPAKSGGKTVYRVSMPSVILNPIMIPASNLTEGAVTSSKLDLLIDAAGKPLSGTATIRGRGRVSGQLQEIVIELKVAFTKVGQKVTISAP